MKKTLHLVIDYRKFIVFTFAILLFAGCSYFKVKKMTTDNLETLANLGTIYKYFVVHDQNGNIYSLKEPNVEKEALTGLFSLNPTNPIYYKKDRPDRYKRLEKSILHEVHIYLWGDLTIEEGTNTIPLNTVNEIHIIEKDSDKTVTSYVGSSIGVAAGALVIAAAIAAALKNSCPYIYVNDGENFIFLGETYGGAIASNLERKDYMPLPGIQPLNDTYQVRLSNELKERQHTNMANLMVIQHPENSQALIDQNGTAHLLQDLQVPIRATTTTGMNVSAQMESVDNDIFMFNETRVDTNRLHLTFQKPLDATASKLFLHAKNTAWFDHIIGKMFENFGGFYNTFMNQEKERPAAERFQDFKSKGIMLDVFVKTDEGWEYVDFLHTIGPMASRDFVIPIDLTKVTGETVEIKIETGFMFWDVDCAKMDFSVAAPLTVSYLKPSLVIDHEGNDHTAVLANDDEQYLVQANVGDVAELHYPAIQITTGQKQTVFLHSKGYYEPIRTFTGMPNLTKLYKFKNPKYLSQFSKEMYLEYIADKEALLANHKMLSPSF